MVTHTRPDRDPLDFYATPPEATRALLSVEQFEGPIWEPMAGEGHMSDILTHSLPNDVFATDINRGEDFFDTILTPPVPNIITNPAYKVAQSTAERALDLATDKVALLLKLAFFEGEKRNAFFEAHPPTNVYVFSDRLRVWRDGCFQTGLGQFAHAWFVWNKAVPPGAGTQVRWLIAKKFFRAGDL